MDKTPEEIALTFSEIFQNNYPKKPLWQMMVDLEKQIKEYGKQQYSKGFEEGRPDKPCRESFDKINDLRPFLLLHPDQEMIKASCLHYLGDEAQEWYNSKQKKQCEQ